MKDKIETKFTCYKNGTMIANINMVCKSIEQLTNAEIVIDETLMSIINEQATLEKSEVAK